MSRNRNSGMTDGEIIEELIKMMKIMLLKMREREVDDDLCDKVCELMKKVDGKDKRF